MWKQVLAATALSLLAACAPPPESATPAPYDQRSTPLPQNTVRGSIPENVPAVKIGLLVPLTGDSSPLGNALLDAATLAVYDTNLSLAPEQMTSQIVLVPKDSGITPRETTLASKQAIDQGSTMLLGPLFSANVPATSAAAKEKNIPVITFSNNRALAQPGTMVFGFIPEQQIDRIAEYAFQHQIARIAVLAPNDAYGEKVRASLNDAAGRNGGQIKNVELYSSNSANLDAAITRLAQAYTTQPPEQRFQALFIAEGGLQLRTILDTMKKHQLDPKAIKLLGTGQWDDDTLLRNPDMTGAWFASAPPEASQNFERRFMATYHYKPARIASLSYDLVTILSRIALTNHGQIPADQLMTSKGFLTPANGLLRFGPDGVALRKLAVMEITPQGFKVLDPAPKSF